MREVALLNQEANICSPSPSFPINIVGHTCTIDFLSSQLSFPRPGILTKPPLRRSRFYSRHPPFHLRAVPSRNKTETPQASILPNGRKSRQPTRLAVEGPKGLRIGLYYCFLPRGISINQFASSSHSIHLHHPSASSSTSTSSQILL